jgi:hypothetical protein
MINLMQQLQAWADEGRYDFEGRRFRTPCAWVDIENPNPNQLKILREHYGYYEITDYILDKIKCVLDGTIQVWRPVEHYKPKDDERVLLYDPTHTDEYGEPLNPVIGYYSESVDEFHRFEIYRNCMTLMNPTHWQPLPKMEVIHA